MKKLMLTLFAACASMVVVAANHEIEDLSSLATGVYFEGDTLTLPAGEYTMRGDAIATVAGNIVTCKKSGYAALSDGSATYALRVLPQAMPGGDVFYFNQTANEGSWSNAGWEKMTQNTDRTVPNNENDIAFLYSNAPDNEFDSFLIDVNVKVHGYVVALADEPNKKSKTQFKTTNGSSFTFCGTAAAPAFFRLSTLDNSDDAAVRVGQENGTGNSVLNINIEGPRLEFDFCGDSAACANPRQKTGFQMCSVVFNVAEGQTLAFCNGSKQKEDFIQKGNTSAGCLSGAGAVVLGVPAPDFLKAFGVNFAGEVGFSGGSTTYNAAWPSSAPIRLVGASKDIGKPTTLSLGDNANVRSSNPGVNMIESDDVYISGGVYETLLANDNNGNYRWTNGVELALADDLSPWYDAISQTNRFRQVTIDGEATFMGQYSHGDWRPRLYLDFDKIVRANGSDTLFFRGYSFRYDFFNAADPDVQLRGKVVGKAFADADGFGHDAGGDEDPTKVYKILPWVTCTYNNGNYNQFNNEWAAQDVFPGVFGNVLRLANNLGNGNNTSSFDAAQPSDNVIFQGKGIGISSDKTINSLVYGNAETQNYPGNMILGEGRTLTITSGGLIMSRTGRWLGAMEWPEHNSKITLAKSGTVRFGAKAYIWSTHGRATGTGDGNEWNSIFAKCVAPDGMVKAGIGDLVLAQDQTGIDGGIVINSGILWLGHPGLYRHNGWAYGKWGTDHPERIIGAATDVESVTIRCGGVLGIPSKGYDVDGSGTIDEGETAISKDAVIKLVDNAAGSSKVEIAAGADQTCAKLIINDKAMSAGTYGATGSGAANIDDDHFAGTGVLTVSSVKSHSGLRILLR